MLIIEDREPYGADSFGHVERCTYKVPRGRHIRWKTILPIVRRSRLNRSCGLLPDRVVGQFVLDQKTHFRTGKIMSGLQHIRHISGEREIQLMADRERSSIKRIISSDSIDLQEVAAAIVIRIGMVVLDEPLGKHISGSTGLQVILPAMLGNHTKSAADSGEHVKDLSIASTHGRQADRAGDRIGRIVAAEVFTEKNCSPRTDFIGDLVLPRIPEGRTASFNLLHVNRLAGDPFVGLFLFSQSRCRHTIPAFLQVRRSLGITPINATGAIKTIPINAIHRELKDIPIAGSERTVILKVDHERNEGVRRTERICSRLDFEPRCCTQTTIYCAPKAQKYKKI